MGATLWLEIRGHPMVEDERRALLGLEGQLDPICEKLGVMPISTFFDDSKMVLLAISEYVIAGGKLSDISEKSERIDKLIAKYKVKEELGDAYEESKENRDEFGEWFQASLLIGTLESIKNYLQKNTDALRTSKGEPYHIDWVMEDIDKFLVDLRIPSSATDLCRLMIVP